MMYAYEVCAPYKATRKSKCPDSYCREPIVRGDIVVHFVRPVPVDEGTTSLQVEQVGDPFHIDHYLRRVTDSLRDAEYDLERVQRVADTVLAFCAGLSAVNADWIGQQYRALERPR